MGQHADRAAATGPNDDIELERIVDFEAVRGLMEDFHALTGHLMTLIDLEGHFLVSVGMHRACTDFHRANPVSSEMCRLSDMKMVVSLPPGEVREYTCLNGLRHLVTPLYVGDRHVANVFTTQFFFEDERVDTERFERQAERFGYDRDDYLAAIGELPRYSRADIDALMRFYIGLTQQVAALGHANAQMADVMAVKQEALALRAESEASLRELIQRSPMPTAINGPDETVEFVNDAFTSTFGYTIDDVPTVADWFRVAIADDAQRAVAVEHRRADLEGASRTIAPGPQHELRVTCKDGSPRVVLASRAVVGDRAIVMMNDISERKRVEEQLSESQRIARVGHYRWDIVRNWWAASPALMDIFGIDESYTSDLAGFLAIVHPSDRADVSAYVSEHVVAGRQPFDREYRICRIADGAVRWVHGLGTLDVDAAGQPELLFGVIQDITDRKLAELALQESSGRLERMVHDVAETMGRIVEARDPYTQGHQQRVAALSTRIARKMGLPQERIDEVEMAGLLHDVGKLRVPTEILTKPGRLSAVEFDLIKEHSTRGSEILRAIDFPWPIADIALQHHERMDGSGYPAGLAGDEIMLSARILAVADVVEAMASHRPYRAALGEAQAIAEITAHPAAYDPGVVAAVLSLHDEGALWD